MKNRPVVQEIEKRLSISEKLEQYLKKSLGKIDLLRYATLQKAFDGKLVKQDLLDEPAAILLANIKTYRDNNIKPSTKRNIEKAIYYTNGKTMAEELKSILSILQENKNPVSSKTLWLSSMYSDDIDNFYSALRVYIESGEIIELPRKGKESFLKLAESK